MVKTSEKDQIEVTQKLTKSGIVSEGKWRGNVLFLVGDAENYPFAFGASKAKKLLNAMDALGAEKFRTLLEGFVEENGKKDRNDD